MRHKRIGALNFVYAYIDDFLIASEHKEQHRQHFRTLFNRLDEYTLVINPAKCECDAGKITFLEYIVTTDGIKPLVEPCSRQFRSTAP